MWGRFAAAFDAGEARNIRSTTCDRISNGHRWCFRKQRGHVCGRKQPDALPAQPFLTRRSMVRMAPLFDIRSTSRDAMTTPVTAAAMKGTK